MAKKDKTDDQSRNADRDAIDRLPLSSIPLASGALKNAKLIKNARMETTVELHSDPVSGSLQISPDAIGDFMQTSPRDQAIINSLAGLHSFDVYSLRSNLKKLGLEVEDDTALELSDDMKEGLSIYGGEFVRPLVEKIFGSGREDLHASDGLQKIFRDPDVARVKENLKTMSQKTGIPLAEIPAFLEEYSDVFHSVAYYRYGFESVGRDVDRFLLWAGELRAHRDIASSPKGAAACRQAEETMRFLAASLRERLAQFQSGFETFWKDINRASFQQMRTQIEENHASMGSVLCGVIVKLRLWKKEFPDNNVGGPATRIKFVMTELEPGLAKLKELELEARKRLGLKPLKV
jgi:DNA-binding transcriptional MerR regulator